MALKANIFTQVFDDLCQTVADYGHYQHFLQWQLKQGRKSVERSLTLLEKRGKKEALFTANCQSIVNPFHDGKWVIRAPYGKRVSQTGKGKGDIANCPCRWGGRPRYYRHAPHRPRHARRL